MTRIHVLSVLFLLAGCVMAAAGCIGQDWNDKSMENRTTGTPIAGPSVQSSSQAGGLENYWVTIHPVDDTQCGKNFTVTSTTNLPSGGEISFRVYRSMTIYSWEAGCRNQSCVMGTVTVVPGENEYNITVFDVNSSALVPDEYIISEKAAGENASAAILMNLIP